MLTPPLVNMPTRLRRADGYQSGDRCHGGGAFVMLTTEQRRRLEQLAINAAEGSDVCAADGEAIAAALEYIAVLLAEVERRRVGLDRGGVSLHAQRKENQPHGCEGE